MISIIAAVAENRVIGNNGDIPWYIPDDFKHFKETTLNSTIIMGSKTWDSLPKKPLPKRQNVIMSRTRKEDNGIWVSNKEDAIKASEYDDIYVIGGEQIYQEFMDIADFLIISQIKMKPSGDTFFPIISNDWEIIRVVEHEDFDILTYKRLTI